MKATSAKATKEGNDVFTYRRIRRAIGLLGLSLPVVLVCFSFVDFFQTRLQPSISHYYYTNLRDIFTGTLCAVGLFLFLYKGHRNKSVWKNDNLLTNIAGVMAFGVAFIPVTPENGAVKFHTLVPYNAAWLGWLHYGCAAALFLIFSNLAINVFTLGQEENKAIPVSRINENKIYRVCGYAILIFIALIPIADASTRTHYSTLWLEALALFSFGFAWLIKGRALGDTGKIGTLLYRERNATAAPAQDDQAEAD